MRRSHTLPSGVATLICAGALLAPSAPAQVSPAPGAEASQAPAGSMRIAFKNGQKTKSARWFAKGQPVKVVARSRPFVPGQVATLEFVRGGKVVSRQRARIRRSKSVGRAVFRFKPRKSGKLALIGRHKPTAQQGGFRGKSIRMVSGAFRAGEGERGTKVVLLQRALKKLGYATPETGYYDGGTARAVLAFRKANGMSRDGYALPSVFEMAFRGRGAFKARFPKAGKHVEFDWSRQVLALMQGAKPVRVYHASSGKPSTPTVFGSFEFYRKEPGTNSHGMVESNYFIGGYAIHGYVSVPAYAASHGCIRVPIPNAAQIDRQIDIGEKIFVYR